MTGTQPFPEKPPAVSTQAASLSPAGTLPIDFRGGPFTRSTAGMLRGIKSGLEYIRERERSPSIPSLLYLCTFLTRITSLMGTRISLISALYGDHSYGRKGNFLLSAGKWFCRCCRGGCLVVFLWSVFFVVGIVLLWVWSNGVCAFPFVYLERWKCG